MSTQKKVHFDPIVITHEYYQEIPCLQEHLENLKECKKLYLQREYLNKNGTLEGFDYLTEYALNEQENERFERELNLPKFYIKPRCEIEQYLDKKKEEEDQLEEEEEEDQLEEEEDQLSEKEADIVRYDDMCLKLLFIVVITCSLAHIILEMEK